jgi:hypothetical protein
MEETSASLAPDQAGRKKSLIILGALALFLIVAAFFAYQAWSNQQARAVPKGSERLSAADFEARYGLRVHLIGVTAAGGMIDLRLKIVDPHKAQDFLEEPDHLPELIVADSGEALLISEGLDDDIEWTEGGILFNFYSNDNGLIQPGTPVIVQFGDKQIKPIEAQ